MNLDLGEKNTWQKFILFAFQASDFFSLTNYCSSTDKKLNYQYYCLNDQLLDYKLDKSELLPKGIWGEYTISYYECNFNTMTLIKEVNNIWEMVFPYYPENISFYKNGEIWFESITHDRYWKVLNIDSVFLEELQRRLI